MFIYIRDGNLFLTVPIIAGTDIAVHNTCKTFNSLKNFQATIDKEIEFFDNLFQFLGNDFSQLREQILEYKKVYEHLSTNNAFYGLAADDFNSTGLSEVLKELNCMVLDPQNKDNFLKSTPEFNTFSLAHNRLDNEGGNLESAFGLKLRQEIGKVVSIAVKTQQLMIL